MRRSEEVLNRLENIPTKNDKLEVIEYELRRAYNKGRYGHGSFDNDKYVRFCKECGERFESYNGKKIFCSELCSRSYHNTKNNLNPDPRRKTYQAWYNMIQRCHNEKDPGYVKYGAAGVMVCDRWRKSFNNFREDMGLVPDYEASLDRINPWGDYEPNNCRWAYWVEQSRNQRHRIRKMF